MEPIPLERLVAALDAIYDPCVTPEVRREAHQLVDIFRESPSSHANIGFTLVGRQNLAATHRYFGLQLVENSIKFNWNNVETVERQKIKDSCLLLVRHGIENIDAGFLRPIKDAICRCIVALLVREWPQCWSDDFLAFCAEVLANDQVAFPDVIFLAWSRLVEDVIVLQNVEPPCRRKELHVAVTSNVDKLMLLVKQTLNVHAGRADNPTSFALCMSALDLTWNTVEWMPSALFADGTIVRGLCGLLLDSHGLALPAAKCLWQFTTRKGKTEDRAPVVQLYDDKALATLLSVAEAANTQAASNEDALTFLKAIGCVLDGMGSQLCFEDGKNKSVELPAAFGVYLNALLALLRHPALPLRLNAIHTVLVLVKSSSVTQHPSFVGLLPQIVEAMSGLMVERGHPSKTDDPSCAFSKLEYDDDEEFKVEFVKCRMQTLEAMRLVVVLNHSVAYGVAKQWLIRTLKAQPVPPTSEWDALSRFVDVVVLAYCKMDEFNDPALRSEAIEILQTGILPALTAQQGSPKILHALLSLMTTMARFMGNIPVDSLMLAILDRIFALARLPDDESYWELRSHATNSMIRMSLDYPQLMVPFAQSIFSFLQQSAPSLTEGLKRNIVDALMILCNYMEDNSAVAEIFAPILNSAISQLKSEELAAALVSPKDFATYLGLTVAPAVNGESIFPARRRSLLTAVSVLLFAIRRIEKPAEIHPATSYVQILGDLAFRMMGALNGLYHKDTLSKIHAGYGPTILDLPEVLKLSIINQPTNAPSGRTTNPVALCQNFVHSLTETLMMFLGQCFVRFPAQMLTGPQTSQFLMFGLAPNLQESTDYRLRMILRLVVKPGAALLAQSTACVSLLPFLRFLLPLIYQRLSQRWDELGKLQEARNDADSQSSETEQLREVYMEFMVRLLTREYIDVLHGLLVVDKSVPTGSENGHSELAAKDTEMGGDSPVSRLLGPVELRNLTRLGREMLDDEECLSPLMLSVFHLYTWPDTSSLPRAVTLTPCLLKALLDGHRANEESVVHLFCCILTGLQMHGEHDNVATPILMASLYAYELFRPTFPALRGVMLQIPELSEAALDAFDAKLFTQDKKAPEKVQKEQFKKLVRGIIGQNVGQQFKRKIQNRPLAPFLKISRKQPTSLDLLTETESPGEIGLSALFDG